MRKEEEGDKAGREVRRGDIKKRDSNGERITSRGMRVRAGTGLGWGGHMRVRVEYST